MELLIDITVVVPVYEHWELAFKLIDALAAQDFSAERCQFLLVDNGSSHIPKESEIPGFIDVLYCKKPGSYSARNEGLRHAKGKLIVFTDADCVPESNWLSALWSKYEVSDGKSLIAGSINVRKTGDGLENDVEIYDRALGLPQKRYVKRGYAVTANLAVPSLVFGVVGGFDDFRFSGGDADFCRRAAFNGFPLVYSQSAMVIHPARSSLEELKTKVRRVRGGQISAGSLGRRTVFFIRAFLPPIREFLLVSGNKELNISEKARVCIVQVKLWATGMGETLRLVFGKRPERR